MDDDRSTSTTSSSNSDNSTSLAASAYAATSAAAAANNKDNKKDNSSNSLEDALLSPTNLNLISNMELSDEDLAEMEGVASAEAANNANNNSNNNNEPTAQPIAVASALKSNSNLKYVPHKKKGGVSFSDKQQQQQQQRQHGDTDDDDDDDSYDSDYSDNGSILQASGTKFAYPVVDDVKPAAASASTAAHSSKSSSKSKSKFKGKMSKRPAATAKSVPMNTNKNKLTLVSAAYDLDGDGVLDPIEQAMRDRDKSGRGYLSQQEIYDITREQLAAKHTAGYMKKVIGALTAFVCILALSNLGTSLAAAYLSKETQTNSQSSAIESIQTGETLGYQLAADTFEIEQLQYDERRERRSLIEHEFQLDPLHVQHSHRRLGKNKKNLCGCQKISYDSGKLKEKDLLIMKAKCDGTRTVNIKRKWRDGSTDMDTLCGPGVTISVKGKKKTMKTKDKIRIVDQEIVFEDKKKKDKGKAVFSCERGWCYTSGERFLQDEGEPCDLDHGSDDCMAGLQCYSDDIRDLVGRCTRMIDIMRIGTDIVTTGIDVDRIGGWYVRSDSNEGDQCVRDCEYGLAANCGGLRETWQQEFATAEQCCNQKVGWKRFEKCVRDWPLI